MIKQIVKPNFLFTAFLAFCFTLYSGCKTDIKKTPINENEIPVGIIESDILKMEKYIPEMLSDSNHIVIWRGGSIYFSEYLSALIIEKKQLKDTQLLCHYMTFDPIKPSNYRNWKYTSTFEITLDNSPFRFPLKTHTTFLKLDSIGLACHCEGIKANVYFIKDNGDQKVYPINQKYNSKIVDNIVKLFKQISKREHIQTFAITNDTIDYSEVNKLIHVGSKKYCINEDREHSNQQRLHGDK